MLKIPSIIKERLTLIISCMMVVGIFFVSYSTGPANIHPSLQNTGEISWVHAPVILSLSMILFLIFAFTVSKPQEILSAFNSNKAMISLSLIFIYLFAGFINSDNYHYIFERLQIKLPFLILPICASVLNFSKKSFQLVLFVFLLCTFIVALYVFINYLGYFEQINAKYLESKVMPTPMNHIRFSILAALASYAAYYLFKNHFHLFRFDRIMIICCGIFLFIFLHIYSVRSGIIALYGIAFTEIFITIFKEKKYKKGFIALGILLFIGLVTFNLSPTLKNKIINTKQDINVYQNNGSANNSSLSTRFISYEIAIELFNENKLLGCGLGDLEIKNLALFKTKHPEITVPIIPHNEFLYYLASMGILGLLAFTFCFFFPLFYRKNYQNEFLLMVYVVLFLSFMTEPMIETQLGVACSILFIIFPLMVKKEESIL